MNGRRPSVRGPMLLSLLLVGSALVGCDGGNYSQVTGKVTLDGQPLADALIQFSPANGSPSFGRTDATGTYELVYSRDAKGAEPGEHTVRITTGKTGDPDGDPPTQDVPEKLPAKYHAQTELKAEVKSGSNVHNFDLTSK